MKKLAVCATILAVAAGCAHSPPPQELKDARSAYARAQQSPGAPLAQADLHDARQALAEAENAYQDDGDSRETRDLAYVATRRAVSARAKADTMKALSDKQTALNDLQQFKQQQAMATKQNLERTKGALSSAQQAIDSERQARVAAEQKAQEQLQTIEGLKSQQSERGTVLTLSGSVLFASGKSALLPTAKDRLKQVAEALKDDKRPIDVLGYTDSVGSDEKNQRLSQQRADSVRAYLISNGIPADRIRAEGMGKSNPIADNATPAGRANNRRVELVLEKSEGRSGQGTGASPNGTTTGTTTTPPPSGGNDSSDQNRGPGR